MCWFRDGHTPQRIHGWSLSRIAWRARVICGRKTAVTRKRFVQARKDQSSSLPGRMFNHPSCLPSIGYPMDPIPYHKLWPASIDAMFSRHLRFGNRLTLELIPHVGMCLPGMSVRQTSRPPSAHRAITLTRLCRTLVRRQSSQRGHSQTSSSCVVS